MKHYKDADNRLFGYADDGSQDHLIGDKILLSDEEFAVLQEVKKQEVMDNVPVEIKMAIEMPSQQDQMEALLTGGQVAADMLAKIKAVKDKYANQ
jgi:hypothetical protein